MPPRRQPRRRLKGLARAMAQAGVDWDPKEAERIRHRPRHRDTDKPQGPAAKRELPDRGEATTDWMPLPALAGTMLAGLAGYFLAEDALAPMVHPIHWVGTVVLAALGVAEGLAWHRMQGYV